MTIRSNACVRFVVSTIPLIWQLTAPAAARAQAWLPAKGEGSVSFMMNDMDSERHLFQRGERVNRGQIRSETALLDAIYGVTDKLTVGMALPYVRSKYTGAFPHVTANGSSIDTGAYHSTLQDLRFDVRYNAYKGFLVVTPFAGTIAPSRDYQYFGHSAAGRDLRELQVGTYVATRLDRVLPGTFVQGRYSYGFVERVMNVSHNRSNMDLEVGYFLRPSLRVFGMGAGQITHGGLDFPTNFRDIATPEQCLHHDQIARDNFLNLGGGAAYALSDSVDLFASAMHMVTGRNGHALQLGTTFGLTYSFARGARAAALKDTRRRSLVKCLCEKNAS